MIGPARLSFFAQQKGRLLLSLDFSHQSGRSVRVAVWGVPRNREKLRWALESALKSIRWDEEAFGREYDLDAFHIACVDGFNAGAMENKGLNIFNCDALLADPKVTSGKGYTYSMANAVSSIRPGQRPEDLAAAAGAVPRRATGRSPLCSAAALHAAACRQGVSRVCLSARLNP